MVADKALEAAKLGDLELLESLNLSRCLNDQVADSAGATCVHYAARAGNLEILDYLVTQCGFRGNKRSKIGATAAHDAAATGNLDCLTFMLDFLKTGCQVDDTDSTGATVLHLASRFGHYNVVRWVLENTECNATRKTAVGALPIHFAAARGDLRIVRLLVWQVPSTINMQMSNGVTAVYLACQEGHLDVVKFLILQAGASLKIPAHDGMKCIHSAAQSGHVNIISYLVLEQNCDPNERDFEGTTPMHFAASRGHTKVLKWLLQNGGKILMDNLGGSPLHDAAEHGQLESISVMLEHGCDPTLADNNGLTAEELAEHCLHRECAILIRQFRPSVQNGHTYRDDVRHNTNVSTGKHHMGNGFMNGHGHTNGVEVEVHRTQTDVAPPKRQCLSAETGETLNHQVAQLSRPVSYPPAVVMNDTHSDISSTTSSLSTVSYHERAVEQERMQTSSSEHFQRNTYSSRADENHRPHSPSQLIPPSNQSDRSVLATYPKNQENGESGYGHPWSNQVAYNQQASPGGTGGNHHATYGSSPSNSYSSPPLGSTYGDQNRQGTYPQNRESERSGYGNSWSNQTPYNQPATPGGAAGIHHTPHMSSPSKPSAPQGSTFEDQIRRQSLIVQSKSMAKGYTDDVDMTIQDKTPVPPPPPPMPAPAPPGQAPPAPPVPDVGTVNVKENIAKSKPYQFANPRQNQPNKLNSSMQTPFAGRPNSLAKEKEKEKVKTDNVIAELKSVNLVASLRKVKKDAGIVVFDSTQSKSSKSPAPPVAQKAPSPVLPGNLTPDLPFERFLEEVPDRDAKGNEVPTWRRQLLARQLMERTKKEYDEKQKAFSDFVDVRIQDT